MLPPVGSPVAGTPGSRSIGPSTNPTHTQVEGSRRQGRVLGGEATEVRSRARVLELTLDPVLDVLPSVADVSSDPEPWRSFSPVPPLVEGGHRHSQVVGEILHAEKAIGSFHVDILRVDAFIPVAETMSSTLQSPARISGTASRRWPRDDRRMTGSRTLCGQGCRLIGGFVPLAVALSSRSQNRLHVSSAVGDGSRPPLVERVEDAAMLSEVLDRLTGLRSK